MRWKGRRRSSNIEDRRRSGGRLRWLLGQRGQLAVGCLTVAGCGLVGHAWHRYGPLPVVRLGGASRDRGQRCDDHHAPPTADHGPTVPTADR